MAEWTARTMLLVLLGAPSLLGLALAPQCASQVMAQGWITSDDQSHRVLAPSWSDVPVTPMSIPRRLTSATPPIPADPANLWHNLGSWVGELSNRTARSRSLGRTNRDTATGPPSQPAFTPVFESESEPEPEPEPESLSESVSEGDRGMGPAAEIDLIPDPQAEGERGNTAAPHRTQSPPTPEANPLLTEDQLREAERSLPTFGPNNRVELEALLRRLNEVAQNLPPDFKANGFPLADRSKWFAPRFSHQSPDSSSPRPNSSIRPDLPRPSWWSQDQPGQSSHKDDIELVPRKWMTDEQLRRMLRDRITSRDADPVGSGKPVENADWSRRVFESMLKAASAHGDELIAELQRPENQRRYSGLINRAQQINDWLVKQRRESQQRIHRSASSRSPASARRWIGDWNSPGSLPDLHWESAGVGRAIALLALGSLLVAGLLWSRQRGAGGRGWLPVSRAMGPVVDRETLISAVHGTARREFGPESQYWTARTLAARVTGQRLERTRLRSALTDVADTVADGTQPVALQRLVELYDLARYARPEYQLSDQQLAEAREGLLGIQRPAHDQEARRPTWRRIWRDRADG